MSRYAVPIRSIVEIRAESRTRHRFADKWHDHRDLKLQINRLLKIIDI